MIIKLQDDEKDYSWKLFGNNTVDNYNEFSFSDRVYYGDEITPKFIGKKRFEKVFEEYKKDPLASIKAQVKPEMLKRKMPGTDITYEQMLKSQDKLLKDYFNSNNNPIER